MCLFDVAATGDLNIGGATKDIGKELQIITELLKPSMILIIKCTYSYVDDPY